MNIERDDLTLRAPCDEEILARRGLPLPPRDFDACIVNGFIAMEAENARLRRELHVVNEQRLALMELCKKQRAARKRLKVLLESYDTRTKARTKAV